MKAIYVSEFGGPEVLKLEDIPPYRDPSRCAADEASVRTEPPQHLDDLGQVKAVKIASKTWFSLLLYLTPGRSTHARGRFRYGDRRDGLR
jgi:hypothetical protein